MLKKIAKVVGSIVLLILVLLFVSAIYGGYKNTEFEHTAEPYINEMVPEISKWDSEITRQYMAAEASNSIKNEDLVKLMKWFSKLGALKKLEKPQMQNYFSNVSLLGGGKSYVTYSVVAHYEAGDAQLAIKLVEDEGKFKVASFNINSPIFMQ